MRRWSWKVPALVLGAALLVAGILWRPVAEPLLVRFPGDLDVTTHYAGTFTLAVDSKTGAPLASPQRLPLTVDRHLQAVPGGGAKTVVVRETLTLDTGGQRQAQASQYVMNRRTMRNVKSPLSWAFDPKAVVDRSGSYYLSLPLSTDAGASYRTWKDETASAYPLNALRGGRTAKVGGLSTIRLAGAQAATPVSAVEAAALQAQGFPASLTAAQMGARLRAAGVDLQATTRALAAVLSPAELQRVGQAMAAPVALRYQWATSGQADVEQRTGAIVQLSSVVEKLTVKPDTSGMAALAAVLAPHAANPAVAKLIATLQALGNAPAQPVYQLAYDETPASVASTASMVSDRLTKLKLVKVYIPWSAILVGLALLALAGALNRRQQPPPSGRSHVRKGEPRRVRT